MTRKKCSVYSHYKHKKILKQSKGYYGSRSRCFKTAKQSVIKSGQYSYIDRKTKKRNMRKLWIIRLNAATRNHNIKYSEFINLIKKKNINLNRKILSQIAINNKNDFNKIISIIKQ